ncbi:hypothetical protein MBLNU457_3946t3 [Dothideomycetes sp. NU457]
MAAVAFRTGAVMQRSVGSVLRNASRAQVGVQRSRASLRPFSVSSSPLVKKYTQDHEWVDVPDGSDIGMSKLSSFESEWNVIGAQSLTKTGTIGITKYAANALGDVVYCELPQVDMEVSAGDTIGAVESVKSASDIMTPVTGIVVEINEVLEEKPGTINKGPETDGWLAKIKIASADELEGLMDEAGYKSFTEESTGS